MLKCDEKTLERFASKCEFDPTTGCVVWKGGTTRGRGKTALYGAFWFQGRSWRAHRWSAEFIHGQEFPDGHQVDHCCPNIDIPNTLCIEHVQAIPAQINRELQWIRVQVGIDDPPPLYSPNPDAIPFYSPPAWFLPFMETNGNTNDAPF